MRSMRIITRSLAAAALLAATSCSSTVRSGNSSMFLVIDSLGGISGGSATAQPSTILFSDLVTSKTSGNDSTGKACSPTSPCPVVFPDNGSVTLELARKDVSAPTAPTTNNHVTINRIHVHYHLANGGGVQGVDVPVDFDTFATVTVPATGTATLGFELVRLQAKISAPLIGVLGTGGILGVVADVTFFGKDQVGTDISVMGSIQIQFSDWAG
jgi:hypothetical protein